MATTRAPAAAVAAPAHAPTGPVDALRRHWPEYLIEAGGLGVFMISAGVFTALLIGPASPVSEPMAQRALIGLAMGLTAAGIIYSPFGRRSGAHLNPAVTLTFYRLGKVEPWDAVFYVVSQFLGGLAGVAVVAMVLGTSFTAPPVDYVVTVPGAGGIAAAAAAEVAISFGLMLMVLVASNNARLMRFTGLFAGLLITLYITFEAPLSGMSMNPARSLASALPAGLWDGLWLYFVAPPVGMLLAVEAYRLLARTPHVFCAKLNHHTRQRCIFRCSYVHLLASSREG